MEERKEYDHILTPKNAMSIAETVELKIPVPWGHIAAKAWGDPRGEPILAVHGYLDNAGSFDTLIPVLQPLVGRPMYIVCVDMPGHGLSSAFPKGIPYSIIDLMGSLHRVTHHLGWHKFSYLGHSMGGIIGYHLAASYPERVMKLLVLDAVKYKTYPENLQLNYLRSYGEKQFSKEKIGLKTYRPPAYTLDNALKRLAENRGNTMTENGLKALASRCLMRAQGSENLYHFTFDPALKNVLIFPPFVKEECTYIMSQVRCQVLIILTDFIKAPPNSQEEALINAVAKSSSYFRLETVSGDHDVHLNFPEKIAPLLAKFILGPSSSL